MGRYEFDFNGIQSYYQDAYTKKNKKPPQKSLETGRFYEYDLNPFFVGPFFDTTTHKNEKDYHVWLDKLDTPAQDDLWLKRLRHCCSVLEKTFTDVGDVSGIFVLGIFGSESVSSDIDVGVGYRKGYVVDVGSPKISAVIKKFEFLSDTLLLIHCSV